MRLSTSPLLISFTIDFAPTGEAVFVSWEQGRNRLKWRLVMAVQAFFKSAFGYQGDPMNLPVGDVDAALPFYTRTMGFAVVGRSESPRSATLGRDSVQIALVENGGDPQQDGCFFEVDDVETAFAELKANGLELGAPDFRINTEGEKSFKVFFVIAPDGLCFCLGQRVDDAAGTNA